MGTHQRPARIPAGPSRWYVALGLASAAAAVAAGGVGWSLESSAAVVPAASGTPVVAQAAPRLAEVTAAARPASPAPTSTAPTKSRSTRPTTSRPTTTRKPATTSRHRPTSHTSTCDLSGPPVFGDPAHPNLITNRDCGYTDTRGRSRSHDPWIDGQLLDAG